MGDPCLSVENRFEAFEISDLPIKRPVPSLFSTRLPRSFFRKATAHPLYQYPAPLEIETTFKTWS
jgi:hypothetical protein